MRISAGCQKLEFIVLGTLDDLVLHAHVETGEVGGEAGLRGPRGPCSSAGSAARRAAYRN